MRIGRERSLHVPNEVVLFANGQNFENQISIFADIDVEIIGAETSCSCIDLEPRAFHLPAKTLKVLSIKSSKLLSNGGEVTLYLKSGRTQHISIVNRQP
jgi:hypothetical protein